MLRRVLQRTLPHFLGFLYRQRWKEAQQDATEVFAFDSDKKSCSTSGSRWNFERRPHPIVPFHSRTAAREESSQRLHPPMVMTLGAQYPSSGRPRHYLCNARTTSSPTTQQRYRLKRSEINCERSFRWSKCTHFATYRRSATRLVSSLCSHRHLTAVNDIQFHAKGVECA